MVLMSQEDISLRVDTTPQSSNYQSADMVLMSQEDISLKVDTTLQSINQSISWYGTDESRWHLPQVETTPQSSNYQLADMVLMSQDGISLR